MLKETSVVNAIALADVLYITKDLIGSYCKTSETLLLLVLLFGGAIAFVSCIFAFGATL